MPVASDHPYSQIQIGGNVASETWLIGFWLRHNDSIATPSPSQMNTYVSTVLSGFNTQVWSAASVPWKNLNATGVTLANGIGRFYRAGALTVNGTASITAVAGAGSGGASPGYCAQCVSLLTSLPGRTKRGRIYLPYTVPGLSQTTLQTTTLGNLTGLLTNLHNYFNTSNVLAPTWDATGTSNLVVMSQSTGTSTDVTTLRTDSIPDTQHGRTRKLVPSATPTQAL